MPDRYWSSDMDAELFDPRTAFAELGRIMLGAQDLNQTLQRIADLARKAIPEIDEVSVTLVDGGQPKTVVFTGQLAVHLDERQYETANGPCLDAAVSGQTIVIDTSEDDTGYPEFASAARRQGVTHVLSIGLPVPQRVVGALNLYASTTEAIRPDTVAQAQAFASYAGVTVANAALYTSTAELAEQMRTAMQTRSVIEQAKGILMERHGYSDYTVFKALSTLSQRSNRKLRDVATAIVQSTRSPL
jgi:GAF domain-containing protein